MSQPVRIYDSDGNEIQCTDGKLPVAISSSALPTGAATAANQAAGNASLSSMDGKLPALSGGKVPVEATVNVPITNNAIFSMAYGGNRDIKFIARAEGYPGQLVAFEGIVPTGNNALSISVSGKTIIISSATTDGVPTSTASDVMAAIALDDEADAIVRCELASGSSGAGVFGLIPHTHLMLPTTNVVVFGVPHVILYGTQSDGTITPILVDSSGKIITVGGT